jgi:lambda repressor-like predicted transcriptional regulator
MTKVQPPEERFAAAVGAKLEEQQRSVAWLSRQIGAAPSTIGYQLRKPASLSLRHACALRDALGVEL